MTVKQRKAKDKNEKKKEKEGKKEMDGIRNENEVEKIF